MLKKLVILVVAVSGLAVGGLAGIAYSNEHGEVGVQSHTTTIRGNVQKKLMVMTSPNPVTVSSTTLTQLTADSIDVPASGNYRAVVRFSAESACSAGSWCSAQILFDGVEANPKVGTDFAFDSPGGETWQSLSMDRTSDVVAGTGSVRPVIVEVRAAVVGGGTWRIDDWSVVTELIKV